MHDRAGGLEFIRAAGPTPVLDAKDAERKRLGANRNNAVFPYYSILFASGNHLACKQQQRALAAIDEHQLIHLRAAVGSCPASILSSAAHIAALLGDNGVA